MRIIIGFLVAGIGFLMVYKTNWFYENLGSISWAERNLMGGGSRLVYKLLGMVTIIVGFLVVTNLHKEVIGGILASIFG